MNPIVLLILIAIISIVSYLAGRFAVPWLIGSTLLGYFFGVRKWYKDRNVPYWLEGVGYFLFLAFILALVYYGVLPTYNI